MVLVDASEPFSIAGINMIASTKIIARTVLFYSTKQPKKLKQA